MKQFRTFFGSLIAIGVVWTAMAQEQDYNARGLDPRVDYNEMYRKTEAVGIPWDDRNLELIKEDLALLPPDEWTDRSKIPFWFRVALRKEMPKLRKTGKGQYPLSAPEAYRTTHGGVFKDGVFVEFEGSPVTVNGEIEITTGRDSAESAIAINPVNPDLVLAGVNGPSGQEMYYSSDGGTTWQRSLSSLGASCCDPTIEWSTDGSMAIMSQLGNCFFSCNIEVYTSFDNGVTWGNMVLVDTGSDKEFLHVDRYPTSPHFGNVYLHYHSGNVIQFTRSLDNGATWATPQSVAGTTGIGGDVTTDTSGRVYQFWAGISAQEIRMNISNDGGQTFSPLSAVAPTNASFNYFIPSFENRGAPVIVSATTDTTNGPFKDRIYAAWADVNGPEQPDIMDNHSKIVVGWSNDSGATWNITNPHTLDDINSVDRFNPWIEVDGGGNLHAIFYSTQNDPARLTVDLYHTFSADGGVTWEPETRVTSVTSQHPTDNFQWGDYNGMSIYENIIRPIWTDNRAGTTSWTADMDITLGPNFDIATTAEAQTICRGQAMETVTVDVTPRNGFSDPVTFSLGDLPTGFMGNITGNPVTPPGSVQIDITTDGTATEGLHAIQVMGTSGALTHDLTLSVYVRTETVPEVSSWWNNPGEYNASYDFDGNNVIDINDLVSLMSCYPVM